jgi:predicted flap endonuclease-1-like 5' DNA nuclease
MPDITAVHFAIFALLFTVGAALGWIMRGDRSARERIAVNAGWQERVELQEREQNRLAEQNKVLMQSVSEYQAAQKDSSQRKKELAQALKKATARGDELQRQVKDIRNDLEAAIRQRDQLKGELESRDARGDSSLHAIREKDNKIFKLSRELTSWQNRLPPLVAKFRQRDQEAKALRQRLDEAEKRVSELENPQSGEHTRIEATGPGKLSGGLDASNDQYESSEVDLSDLQDQIQDDDERLTAVPVRTLVNTIDDTANYANYTNNFAGTPHPGVNNHSSTAHVAKDDLQRIKGVGPAIERTLHDLGIFSFDQIARISEYDINRIAERLKGFRSRIYREDWIGQARTLHDLDRPDPA